MHPSLRERIVRHLEALPDERAYQVLDYIEFLESKYAEKTATSASLFQRFTEGVEDTLRAGRISTTAIAETMGLLNKAAGVLEGVAAAGRSVASDIVSAASPRPGVAPAPATPATPVAPPAADPAGVPAATPAEKRPTQAPPTVET